MFPGVGRIRRASGATTKATFTAMNGMLTTLFSAGRLDVLYGLRDGTIHPMVVYNAFRVGRLDELPSPTAMLPFADAYEAWRGKLDCSVWHRQSLKSSGVRLNNTLPARGTNADLPFALRELRDTLRATPRTFNVTRSAVLAFLRDEVGRGDALYRACLSIQSLRVKPKKAKRPQTVEALETTLEGFWEDEAFRVACWSMAVTGMGPGEYWGHWDYTTDGIAIHGTKREGRERVVPDVGIALKPLCTRSVYQDRCEAIGLWSPYDMRRSFANWVEAAGIPRTRRKLYMGHGATDITDLYEWHEVKAFLASDAKKLEDYIAGELPGNVPVSEDGGMDLTSSALSRKRTYSLVIHDPKPHGPSNRSKRKQADRSAPENPTKSPDSSPDGLTRLLNDVFGKAPIFLLAAILGLASCSSPTSPASQGACQPRDVRCPAPGDTVGWR